MNLKCMLGAHDWSKSCGECSRCGKTRNGVHDWVKDCGQCSKCGMVVSGGHSWDGRHCSVCRKKRPVRPAYFEPQPESIEPAQQDIRDAVIISRLIGYLLVSDHLGRVQPAVESVGSQIVWQLAGKECDFLANARAGAQEAMSKSPSSLRAYCDQHVPLLLKYKFFLDDDKTPFTTGTLEAMAQSIVK